MYVAITLIAMLYMYYRAPWAREGVFNPRLNHRDQYNLLVDGMLQGHLYLKEDIPAGLLALSDPWNPSLNHKYRYGHGLWDQSLYEGHGYLYFGLTPVLALILPFRLLTGGLRIPMYLSQITFAYCGLLFATGLILSLRRRYFPTIPPWMVAAGIVLVGTANVSYYVCAQPGMYQIAICSGICFSTASLYFLSRAFERTSRRGWYLAAAGGALAAAVGSRPHFVLTTFALTCLTLVELRRRHDFTPARLAAFLVPLSAGGAVLALYNFLRFGNFLEFGARYQLGIIDMRTMGMFGWRRIPSTVYFMFLQPPRINGQYPYIHPWPSLPSWIQRPSGFLLERVTGILVSTPFLWLIFFVGAALLLNRKPQKRLAPRFELWCLALTAGIIIAVLAPTVGTMRYLADFATSLDLLAVFAWYHFDQRFEAGTARSRAWRATGVAMIVWSAIVGIAVGLPIPFHYMDG